MRFLVSATVVLPNQSIHQVGSFAEAETIRQTVDAFEALHVPDDAAVREVRITNADIPDPYGPCNNVSNVAEEISYLKGKLDQIMETLEAKKANPTPPATE